jgi:hypothetical protein
MPEPFSVHVDPELLARQDLAAAVPLPVPTGRDDDDRRASGAAPDEHHGARDARLAARQRSERDRAGRASGAGGGRSYAFRRS